MLSMKIQLSVSSGNFPFIYVDSTLGKPVTLKINGVLVNVVLCSSAATL